MTLRGTPFSSDRAATTLLHHEMIVVDDASTMPPRRCAGARGTGGGGRVRQIAAARNAARGLQAVPDIRGRTPWCRPGLRAAVEACARGAGGEPSCTSTAHSSLLRPAARSSHGCSQHGLAQVLHLMLRAASSGGGSTKVFATAEIALAGALKEGALRLLRVPVGRSAKAPLPSAREIWAFRGGFAAAARAAHPRHRGVYGRRRDDPKCSRDPEAGNARTRWGSSSAVVCSSAPLKTSSDAARAREQRSPWRSRICGNGVRIAVAGRGYAAARRGGGAPGRVIDARINEDLSPAGSRSSPAERKYIRSPRERLVGLAIWRSCCQDRRECAHPSAAGVWHGAITVANPSRRGEGGAAGGVLV